jgi:hypothetical protein
VRRALHALVLALLASGCGADLGVLGGVVPRDGHVVAAGRLAASTKLGTPANERGFLLGMQLESRAEAQVGSSWNSGVMLGWGDGPAAIDGRVGWEAYAEFGTPLHQTLFQSGNLYAGLALALPIRLGSPRHVVDMNESTWVLMQRVELVPLLRARVFRDNAPGHAVEWQPERSLGLSVRLRVFSDLL